VGDVPIIGTATLDSRVKMLEQAVVAMGELLAKHHSGLEAIYERCVALEERVEQLERETGEL